jgi:hypothetical protein
MHSSPSARERTLEDTLRKWLEEQHEFLAERLPGDFVLRCNEGRDLPPAETLAGESGRLWVARYLLVHGLAQALSSERVFQCGDRSAWRRERLDVAGDAKAPMAGLLIDTAVGDSDGTLSGLVQQGMNNRLALVVLSARRRISWCSADPIGSQEDYPGVDRTKRAACRGCLLLPETGLRNQQPRAGSLRAHRYAGEP